MILDTEAALKGFVDTLPLLVRKEEGGRLVALNTNVIIVLACRNRHGRAVTRLNRPNPSLCRKSLKNLLATQVFGRPSRPNSVQFRTFFLSADRFRARFCVFSAPRVLPLDDTEETLLDKNSLTNSGL